MLQDALSFWDLNDWRQHWSGGGVIELFPLCTICEFLEMQCSLEIVWFFWAYDNF